MTERQQIFIGIFIKNACNVSVACKKIGLSRQRFYEWYNAIPKSTKDEFGFEVVNVNDFKIAIDEAKESLIDFAESALFRKIAGITQKTTKIKETYDAKTGDIVKLREETTTTAVPDTACIIFLLKSLGRKRGWTDRQDLVLENNLGNELSNDMKESLNKLTPEEKKQLIAISKKITDD